MNKGTTHTAQLYPLYNSIVYTDVFVSVFPHRYLNPTSVIPDDCNKDDDMVT